MLAESNFASLGLKEVILQTLEKAQFKTPSPIQKEVIPLILQGMDVIGQAQTGTGKTAAFGLPALHLLQNTGSVEVLVLTPTRELASQVSEELRRFSVGLKAHITTVYGGKSFHTQIDAIRRGAHIVVATPGRLLDLLESGKVPALTPSLVIVDEADEMLDMGFLEDIQAIFTFLPKERQTLLFSATMPTAIQSLARKILKSPTLVKTTSDQTTNADIAQQYCVIHEGERDEAIIRLFETGDLGKSIIFCKTKKEVDRLSQVLSQRGHQASSLHGDMEQSQREQVTYQFRTGKSTILVATDIAARGLNIIDVSHVINYHLPYDAENYVHRIGRTGRAGRKGSAITLVTPKEMRKLLQFNQSFGGTLERKTIPSKQQLRQIQVRKLMEQIVAEVPALETSLLINSVKGTMDLPTLTGKLLSLALAQNPIEGPETIGIEGNIVVEKTERKHPAERRREQTHRGRRQPKAECDRFGNFSKRKSFSSKKGSKKF